MNTNLDPNGLDIDRDLDIEHEPLDVWAVTAPSAPDRPSVGIADTGGAPSGADPTPPGPPQAGAEPGDWRARVAAGVATVVLIAAVIAFFATRAGSSPTDPAAEPPTEVTAPTATPPAVSDLVIPVAPDVPPVADVAPPVVAVVPDPEPTGGATPPEVPDVDVLEPPPVVNPPVPPAPEPPAPAALLGAQLQYELDPGVDNLTVTLANEGDAALTFSVAGGDDFTVDTADGEIAAGDTFDLWVELSVVADGDGPTPYEVPIDVASNGGDLTIVVSGQVEKPGYLVADYADLPLVDHRGVVSFTNVGELPIEIVGLDAPGITTAPIPDEVAAGETWEMEIAICADTTLEPELTWTLDGQVGFRYDSWVTVETPTSESTTTVSSFGSSEPLPSCEAVVDPIDVMVVEVALP